MENLISFTDLFDAQFVKDVNDLKSALHGLMGELKNVSASVQTTISSSSASSTSLEQLARQVAALEQAYQTLKNAQTVVGNATKNMSNLNQQEVQSVEQLKAELQQLTATRNMALHEIDTEKKSYNELKASYNAIREALNTLNKEQRENSVAGQSMAQQAQSVITAMKNMDNAYKKAAQSVKSLNDVQQRFSKLQGLESANVENFAAQIANVRANLDQTLPTIDMQTKSYNELYASYNVLKDALNQMTIEQRESTAAGKSMTNQAQELMTKLNQLQQATGKYTLNVGNYKSAFDGFGYSIQQVLREVPSAINLNQFFLAISNNIPMVGDQIRKFRAEFRQMNDELGKSITKGDEWAAVGKKIVSSVVNWQSAILLLILALRKWGTQLWDLFKNIFTRVQKLTQAMKDSIEQIKFNIEIKKATSELVTELNLIQDKLKDTTQGSEEWRKAVERINELTKGNLDTISATPAEIKKVTNAYIEQAKQIAINQRVVDKLAEDAVNRMKRQMVVEQIQSEQKRRADVRTATGGFGDLSLEVLTLTASTLGLEKDSKEYKQYEKWLNRVTSRSFRGKQIENINELLATNLPILSSDLMKKYKALYDPIIENTEGGGGGKTAKDRFELMNDLYKEYLEERHKLIKDAFEREIAAENDRYTQQQIDDNKEYIERLQNYEEAERRHLITKEDYKKMSAELTEQYNTIIEAHEKEHYANLSAIQDEWAEKDIEAARKQEQQKLDIMEDAAEKELKIRKKRVRNAKDEIYNNNIVTQNINTYIQLIKELEKELRELDIPDDDETVKNIQERIKKATEAMNKEITHYATSQQTKKFSSLWDVFIGGAQFSGGFKRGVLQKMGVDTDKIQDEELIDGLFQNWAEASADTMKDWASMMKDTLSDVLDAVVDFYQAKAEAAAEDTENAKEEYEKQKALLEAGYANSIETEWQAYQEKKVIQAQAEKEAEQWNEKQRQLSQLETVASLGTAIANLFKVQSFAGIVGVALATAAAGALISSFMASQSAVRGAVQYGEGHVEMIGGGSHASGHDSPLAVDSKGRQRRVEGGEMFAVINKRAVRKYGDKAIADMITQINARNLQVGVDDVKVAQVGMDLSRIERGIDTIISNGSEKRYTDGSGNMIIQRGNLTKRIINGTK